MLAHSFKDNKVNYPCFVQPKFDGVRCIATVQDGIATLKTRKDKPIISMTHITDMLSGFPDGVYDGELYSDTLLFDQISGAVRSHTFDPDRSNSIHFVVYDGYSQNVPSNSTYNVRFTELERIFGAYSAAYGDQNTVLLVENRMVSNAEELQTAYSEFLGEGYEGAMVRTQVFNKKAKVWFDPGYEHKRSYSLLKLKEFQDADFVIVGIQEEHDANGIPKGRTGAFVFLNNNGISFTASGITDEVKVASFNQPDLYVGKTATVKYFELTPDGVPRFPNFVGIRAD